MMELLPLTRRYRATDVRDKVYASMGITIDGKKFGSADYSIQHQQVSYDIAHISHLVCLSSTGFSNS